MRVTCNDIAEFLKCLEDEGNERVFQRTVRVSRSRNPLDDSKDKAVRFSANIQVSTVIDLGDDGQYLLEAGEDCGIDYEDSTREMLGTEQMEMLRNRIMVCCDRLGLKVLPGLIDL